MKWDQRKKARKWTVHGMNLIDIDGAAGYGNRNENAMGYQWIESCTGLKWLCMGSGKWNEIQMKGIQYNEIKERMNDEYTKWNYMQ